MRISYRLSEISKGLTKFHRIFGQEKCEIVIESVMKFRRIFALKVCEISKGETKFRSKCVRNFVLPERATVSFDVGSVMAALILAYRCRS